MATNLAIDDPLLREALEISRLTTKKDTVNLALKELVDRHKQLEIINIFGKKDRISIF
jgi:Arc/MetJ family transcription regulator